MSARGSGRDAKRAASEAAILDAAWDLFAQHGADAVSMRDLGAAAGCTHALIAQYFGTKDDLVGAVAKEVGERVEQCLAAAAATEEPLAAALRAARAGRPCAQLVIRTALGDLPPRGFPACLHADSLLTAPSDRRPRHRAGPDRRARLCAYAASSLALGFITFEGFLVAGTQLARLSPARRDRAMAGAADGLLTLVDADEPRLAARDVTPPGARTVAGNDAPNTAREALLGSAVALFAERGPAATSVRDIAHHAGVNQALVYRHFGSKDALLAEALERGLSDLFPAGLAEEGFDFDTMSWMLHHASAGSRLVARTLVDDIEITTVRRQFPVLARLLAMYGSVPCGAGPGDLSDPRVAICATAAMAMGSAVWGEHLRPALGLSGRDGVESAIADFARVLVTAPLLPRH